jgi:DNA-binding response OmpR family regulator
MKILIAEDDDSLRDVIKLIVANLGHEAVAMSDGAQAWEEFGRRKPSVIISDWVMPELDGLELCRKVRKGFDGAYTYFILLTGKMSNRENYLKAMEAGVDDFMTKPLDEETLRIRLRVAERILGLTSRIGALESFLPICVYCKRIRQDDGRYEQLESYLAKRSEVKFSHGICPSCMSTHHPGEADPS